MTVINIDINIIQHYHINTIVDTTINTERDINMIKKIIPTFYSAAILNSTQTILDLVNYQRRHCYQQS